MTISLQEVSNDIPTLGGTPSTQAHSDAASEGASSTVAKSDHKHGMPAAGGANFKSSSFDRDTTLASGTQAVTGVGFTPTNVLFFGGQELSDEISFGLDDGGSLRGLVASDDAVSANQWRVLVNQPSIHYRENGSVDNYSGQISSFDADGFTITWTKVGNPTGTVRTFYLAMK